MENKQQTAIIIGAGPAGLTAAYCLLKETDIKPMIHSYKKDGKALTCVLSASPSEYLNPEYIAKYLGIPDCTILRTRVLLSDGETAFR